LFNPERSDGYRTNPYYLGFVALALAGLGLWVWWRSENKRWLWWWCGITVATLSLSLGPYLRLNFSDDPATLLSSGIPMPYQLLEKIPLINLARSPLRLLSLATLGISLMAGYGAGWIISKSHLLRFSKSRYGIAATLLLALFIADTLALPLKQDSLYYPTYFQEIGKDSDRSYGLLELPITSHYTRDSRRMFFQTIHQHPIAGGYVSRRVIQLYEGTEPIGTFFNFPPQKPEAIFAATPQPQLKLLQLYNLRYVVLYRDEGLFSQEDIKGLEEYLKGLIGAAVFDDGRTAIFHVPSATDIQTALLATSGGGYEVQKLPDGRAYRWVEKQLEIQIVTSKAGEVQLDLQAWSLAAGNHLEITLNGLTQPGLNLTQTPQPQAVKLNLKTGSNLLRFTSLLPAAFPQELQMPFSDTRRLAFAIGDLSLRS
jgi:hypothetical protein